MKADAEEDIFEAEVRRVAAAMWPGADGGPALVSGRERDAVYQTEDVVHLIECTTSRLKQKAEKDAEKLVQLAAQCRRSDSSRLVKAWFITRDEPTVEQRHVCKQAKESIAVMSFDRFRARIVDAAQYLEMRLRYPFGSARNPETGDSLQLEDYTELALIPEAPNAMAIGAGEVSTRLLDGERFIVLGDYGAGKSMTTREVFMMLRKRYLASKTAKFPLLLNLRDHHGQRIPAEAIERHARNIGFPSPSHLVRAWRSGYVTLLLDGFDEIASPGWSTQQKQIQRIRRDSVELIRVMIRETPEDAGVLLSGREHFFDSAGELRTSLGASHPFQVLKIEDLSEIQLESFLGKRGWSGKVPSWLPSRPLLLAYLASKGLLAATLDVEAGSAPAVGWDRLTTRICEREAEIEPGIDGAQVRRVLERLASAARLARDGLGPIAYETIKEAFGSVCGYEPDDKATVLLQRLPGLGRTRTEDGTRSFIDSDLAAVLRAGDVARFVEQPADGLADSAVRWVCPLGGLGSEVVALRLYQAKVTNKQLTAAIGRASRKLRSNMLVSDLVASAMTAGATLESTVFVHDAFVEEVDLSEEVGDFSSIQFTDCSIKTILAPSGIVEERIPKFVRCAIEMVLGRVSKSDLPAERFEDCEVYCFGDQIGTNSAILNLSVPTGVRVLLTVLRKVFLQRGSGRKEKALMRGLDHLERSYVQEVVNILQREQVVLRAAMRGEVVWLPERAAAPRVGEILRSPGNSDDPLIALARRLK